MVTNFAERHIQFADHYWWTGSGYFNQRWIWSCLGHFRVSVARQRNSHQCKFNRKLQNTTLYRYTAQYTLAALIQFEDVGNMFYIHRSTTYPVYKYATLYHNSIVDYLQFYINLHSVWWQFFIVCCICVCVQVYSQEHWWLLLVCHSLSRAHSTSWYCTYCQ